MRVAHRYTSDMVNPFINDQRCVNDAVTIQIKTGIVLPGVQHGFPMSTCTVFTLPFSGKAGAFESA